MAPADRRLSLTKRVLFSCAFALLAFLAMDVLVVRSFLLARGFHPGAEGKFVVEQGQAAPPDNVVEHPRYLWAYLPGSRRTMEHRLEKVSCELAINSEGFRDEEPSARAGADCRFVALGDSFTFGWLVPHQDRWDEVLARRLSEQSGRRAASVNRGMWLSTFDQHALILEDHLTPDINLVIHLVYPSHLQTINRHQDEVSDGRIVRIVDPILYVNEHHRLMYRMPRPMRTKRLFFPYSWSLLSYSWGQRQALGELEREHPGSTLEELDVYRSGRQHLCERGWRLAETAIRQTAELTRKKNVPYVVVIIPRSLQLSPEAWVDRRPDEEVLSSTVPQERFREVCDQTGWARCLDLLPAMRKRPAREWYYQHDPHWRPAGHAKAAQEILDFLTRNRIVRRDDTRLRPKR
jgi:hypothetical protein